MREQTNTTFQSEIVAPVSGTVVARHVYEGQYVKEGDKLFEIADFSTMWFQFDAYERDLPWLEIGQKIEVTTPAMPNKAYEAKINFIDPNINDPTRSARVRVEIPNPLVERDGRKSRELLHKLYGEAQVKMSLPETLVVPRTAILNGGGEPVVYVEKDSGSYEQRKVKLGRMGDALWEILDGVTEGEKVVTRGNMLIDAQSQLNQGSVGGEMAGMPGMESTKSSTDLHATHDMAKLTEAQQAVSHQFFSVADAVGKALAADDLKAFNTASRKLPPVLKNFTAAFAEATDWLPLVESISKNADLKNSSALEGARKQFLPLSNATAEFARMVRASGAELANTKIYVCPMANRAVPGAPRNGFWIQTDGPLQNPFFGAEMLECGNEVKP